MHSKRLAVVEVANNFLSCRAKEDIKEGSFLTDLWGRVSEKATRYTVGLCNCGAVKCLGEIKGFKFLTPEQQKSREKELSPILSELWR
nr:uncharacterized protein LOC131778333 [Pocillopora verrucosa]